MSTNLELYKQKDFKKLSQKNLGESIDNEGNTIIHIIAENLDTSAFISLLEYNKYCLPHDIVNKQNKDLDIPLHRALKTLDSHKNSDHSIIDFMIGKLNADPNIPDKKGMVIHPYSSESLSDDILRMIKKPSPIRSPDNEYIEFIEKLTDYYINLKSQEGGKRRKSPKKSKGFVESGSTSSPDNDIEEETFTESGENDTFVTKDNSKMMTKQKSLIKLSESQFITDQSRVKWDPKDIEKYNAVLEKIKKYVDDEFTAKTYRSLIKKYITDKDPKKYKGSKGDSLKIEAVNELMTQIANKKQFDKLIDEIKKSGIDIEKIEQFMKKKEEWKQQKSTTSDEKEKPKKKKSTKKVVENGYLRTDEVILSSDED